MPAAHDASPLYSRGRYRLEWDIRKDGSLRTPFLQIVWYDADARRNRSRSTGSTTVEEAERALDVFYEKRERGRAICPTCNRPIEGGGRFPVTDAISSYLVARETRPSFDAISARLAHVTQYLAVSNQLSVACEDINEEWIDDFREWAIEVPVTSASGKVRDRSAGTVEGSVRMLAAAINFAHMPQRNTLYPAAFRPMKAGDVSRTPKHRSDIAELARMFRYAAEPRKDTGEVRGDRRNLLNFLRISVATLARPDAAHDVNTDPARDQWHSQSRTLNLNPKGRRQTRKFRATVPIAWQMARILDETDGFLIPVDSVKSAFETMLDELKLPRDGETGLKLIRRSMANLLRQRLPEHLWGQISMFLGHNRFNTSSDDYAPFSPDYLREAKQEIEAIIDAIEKTVPGAFHRKRTGLRIVQGGQNA